MFKVWRCLVAAVAVPDSKEQQGKHE